MTHPAEVPQLGQWDAQLRSACCGCCWHPVLGELMGRRGRQQVRGPEG